MSTTTRTASVLALALALGACSDAPTTAPTNSTSTGTLAPPPATMEKQAATAPTTTLSDAVLTSAGAVVGTFTGTATLQSVATSGSQLLGNILISGTAVVNGVSTAVSQVVTVPMTTSGTCPILSLDIGAINLNLLGLVVSLAPISLDITAVSGPGNLLGNLLCAVVHLLDGTGTVGGLGTALTNLINTINGLLAGL